MLAEAFFQVLTDAVAYCPLPIMFKREAAVCIMNRHHRRCVNWDVFFFQNITLIRILSQQIAVSS